VVVLPLFTVGIVSGHLIFIQRQGMAKAIAHDKPDRGLKFFPDFALRDLLLWLICLIALASLAVFLPYGPGIPGMEWELGKKANPLAPAYPGIKPEWYFLWVYQLLKEFPPHILGIEGPQAAIALVSVLFGIWALVPWLDRKARVDRPSPAFTDLAMAALIFLAYLTLKAWDIGGGGAAVPDPRAVARACAFWGLLLAAATVVIRLLSGGSPYFDLTAAAVLQIVLHGFFGLPYLAAGSISVVLLAATLFWRMRSARGAAPASPGGQP
jgi:quinol-cytochrome oxidoreductase complex cytochrome b subunit